MQNNNMIQLASCLFKQGMFLSQNKELSCADAMWRLNYAGGKHVRYRKTSVGNYHV